MLHVNPKYYLQELALLERIFYINCRSSCRKQHSQKVKNHKNTSTNTYLKVILLEGQQYKF